MDFSIPTQGAWSLVARPRMPTAEATPSAAQGPLSREERVSVCEADRRQLQASRACALAQLRDGRRSRPH